MRSRRPRRVRRRWYRHQRLRQPKKPRRRTSPRAPPRKRRRRRQRRRRRRRPRTKTAPPRRVRRQLCRRLRTAVRVYVVRGVEGREGKEVASDLGQVELQVMDTESVLAYGRGKMQETDDVIERSKRTVETTIQIGTQTAEALRQMNRWRRSWTTSTRFTTPMRVIKDLTRGLATDKCILTLLFIVVKGHRVHHRRESRGAG